MDLRPNLSELKSPADVARLTDVLSQMGDELDVIYTTTAPNGSISARQGRLALYLNGSTYEAWVNKDGATAWTKLVDSGAISFTRDHASDDYDLAAAPYVTDGTWRDLDISSVVGVGTRLVAVSGYILDDAANNAFMLRRKGNVNQYSVVYAVTQVANIPFPYYGIVATNTSGVIQYYAANTTWSVIALRINGWIALD